MGCIMFLLRFPKGNVFCCAGKRLWKDYNYTLD